MKLIRLNQKPIEKTCPECNDYLVIYECGGSMYECCEECGYEVEHLETRILLSEEKYYGVDNPVSHTATLFIGRNEIATAHISPLESDIGGDIAYIQLAYIPEGSQTEEIANIISEFAEWVRFTWENLDKRSEFPTLVRLMGITSYKDNSSIVEWWTALEDATKIKAEHLAHDFTSKLEDNAPILD